MQLERRSRHPVRVSSGRFLLYQGNILTMATRAAGASAPTHSLTTATTSSSGLPCSKYSTGCETARQLQDARSRLVAGQSKQLFLHLHKSGGTTMCMLAIQNSVPMWSCYNKTVVAAPHGSTDFQPHSACNCNGPHIRQVKGRGAFQRYPRHKQLQVLQQYSAARLFFNEGPLADEMLPREVLQYITLVRHPLPRYMSHLLHWLEATDVPAYHRALQVSWQTAGNSGKQRKGPCNCTTYHTTNNSTYNIFCFGLQRN
jgi:hypothetical protein